MKKLIKIYNSKYFPRLFCKRTDGGDKSGVTAYFLIEWKILFSIGLLKFNKGSREAFHSHAFNALTWWIKGCVTEVKIDGTQTDYSASFKPKYTSRANTHKVISHKTTYALTFRGPWSDTWKEVRNGKEVILTHSRKQIG
jgi:hypothetical protein